MATEAKIILKAQNNMTKELNSAKTEIKSLSTVADSLGINLSKLTKIGAITAALTALKKGVEACTSEFKDNELSYARLQATYNSADYTKVLDTISQLSRVSLASQTEITALAGKIASLGNSADDVERITTATVNWANVTGQDLNSALGNVMDTLNGSVGEMGKYLPSLKELTAEELKAGQGIELINTNLSKYTNTVNSGTFNQTTKNISDSFSTIKSSLGEIMVQMAGPWLTALDTFIEKIALMTESWVNATKSMTTTEGPTLTVNFTDEQLKQQAMNLAKGYSEGQLSESALNMVLSSYNDTEREQVFKAFDDFAKVLKKGVPVDVGTDGDAIRAYSMADAERYNNADYYERQSMEAFTQGLIDASQGLLDIVANFDSTKTNDYKNASLDFEDRISTELFLYNKQLLGEQRKDYLTLSDSLSKVTGSFRTEVEKATESLNSLTDYKAQIEGQISNINTLKDKGVISNKEADNNISSLNTQLELVNRGIESYTSKIEELSKTTSESDILKESTGNLISSLTSATNGYKTEIESLNETLSQYNGYQSQIDTAISDISALIEKGVMDSEEGNALITSLNQQSELIGRAVDDVNISLDEATNPVIKLTNRTNEILNDISSMASSYKTQEEVLSDTLDNLTSAKTMLEEQIAEVTSAIENGNLSSDEGNSQLSELNSNLNLIERGINKTNESIAGLKVNEYTGSITYPSYEHPVDNILGIEGNAFEEFSNFFSEENAIFNLNDILSDSFTKLAGSIEPLFNIIKGGNVVFTALIYIFKGFADTLAPMLDRVIKPITDALEEIGSVIANWFKPLLDALYPIIKTIVDMLMAVLIPTLQILNPFMEMFARLLMLIKEPLMLLASIFVAVGETISWVVDSIKWVFGSFLNWLYSLNINGWRPFGGVGYREVESPGDLGDRINDATTRLYNQVNYDFQSAVDGMGGNDTSTDTAVSNASYTGGSTIHINIYQQAPVVGEDGMNEFAKMIRKEFVELGYYNV